MLLFYLRHGDPIYDPDSLTPLGARQAEALGKRLAEYGLDEIYASSSTRAQLTARPTCEMLKMEPTILPWADEKYCWAQLANQCPDGRGRWVFQQADKIPLLASNEVRALGRKWYDHPYFAGTTYKEGIERVQGEADRWLAGFGYEHDLERNMYLCRDMSPRRVALFAHQGFGLAFLSCVLDVPYSQFSIHFDMTHSGMSVIWFPEEEGWVAPKLLQLSGDGHLYREGLPTRYNNRLRF